MISGLALLIASHRWIVVEPSATLLAGASVALLTVIGLISYRPMHGAR